MRRLLALMVALLTAALCLCSAGAVVRAGSGALSVRAPREGWADDYLAFLQEHYDAFATLWPGGVSGISFLDLDLDGTPEMAVFTQGAASMDVHLFDLADGQVYCVSSAANGAAGVFGGEHLSSTAVCARYFEAFCLSDTEEGWYFWVDSSDSTAGYTWNEIIRFDSAGGILKPTLVCARYLTCDADTGLVDSEKYEVSGTSGTQEQYQAAADVYLLGKDTGYQAGGTWSGGYDAASRDGLLAMAADAADAYVPILGTVTVAVEAS